MNNQQRRIRIHRALQKVRWRVESNQWPIPPDVRERMDPGVVDLVVGFAEILVWLLEALEGFLDWEN